MKFKSLDNVSLWNKCIENTFRGETVKIDSYFIDSTQLYFEFTFKPVCTAIDNEVIGVLIVGKNITDETKAANERILNEKRQDSLINISTYHFQDVQDLLDFSLSEALKLTDSKYGYIYFYDEDTKEFTLNTWSNDVMKNCAVLNPQTKYQLELTGLWGEAVRQAKPIIVNDFSAPHIHKKGLPEGQVMFSNYMTTPIFFDAKIVAVIGVANKKNGLYRS